MAMFGGGTAHSPQPAPQEPSAAGRSYLVAGTKIVGDISAPGLLEIQGQVHGRVTADTVVIEERGMVDGEVQAAAIGVKGTFTGHLNGGIVRVHASARMSGTIRYDTLSVESGSEITATCEKSRAS